MANIVAVLPICAVEQHGAHLPVRVFAAINVKWFTDLVYDGVFEVLQWLLFLSAVGFVNGMVASHLLCHSGTINRHSLNGALLS